jgi:transposase
LRPPLADSQLLFPIEPPQLLQAMKAEAVIPSKRNRKVFIPHNIDVYKHRNRIERCFNRLKHFRRFATRYDRQTIHFEGFVHLAAAIIWLRRMSIRPRSG